MKAKKNKTSKKKAIDVWFECDACDLESTSFYCEGCGNKIDVADDSRCATENSPKAPEYGNNIHFCSSDCLADYFGTICCIKEKEPEYNDD